MADFEFDFESPLLKDDPLLNVDDGFNMEDYNQLDLDQLMNSTGELDQYFDVDTLYSQLPEEKAMPISDHDHCYDLPHGSPGSDRSDPSTSGSSCSSSTLDSGYTSSPNPKNPAHFDILSAASTEIFEFKGELKNEPESPSRSPVGYSQQTSYIYCNGSPTRRYLSSGGGPVRPTQVKTTTVRFKPAVRQFASGSLQNAQRASANSSENFGSSSQNTLAASSTDRNGRKYPALILSEEEKRLCKKEGIVLPDHYPLTKAEERELKRIRRKIRNKKSAQTSRRRKQDYIEALEDRVDNCTQENCELKRQIELLTRENQNILTQLRKVQASLSNSSKRGTQAGTCLAVLLLSVCLLVAPNFSPLSKSALNGHNNESIEDANAENGAATDAFSEAQAQLKAVHMHDVYSQDGAADVVSRPLEVVPSRNSGFLGKSRTLMDFVHPNRQAFCAETDGFEGFEYAFDQDPSLFAQKSAGSSPDAQQRVPQKRAYATQAPLIVDTAAGKTVATMSHFAEEPLLGQVQHHEAAPSLRMRHGGLMVNDSDTGDVVYTVEMEPSHKRYRYQQ
ncbi:bZIP transcription factor family protein [Aphelenchoides avenae]|nr:bZIP transcription factor family protein [Aphelenchus avenae]